MKQNVNQTARLPTKIFKKKKYCKCHINYWLRVVGLNVIIYLCKVNLEVMLVSSVSSYTRGGPMPLAGPPRDLYTQLLAGSSLQSVVAIACCLRAFSALVFFPSLPPSGGKGQVSIGHKYSTELFSVMVPGGDRS